MEKNILEILLTSTVITTLITVIVKLVQGFQTDKINNITKERRAWREKIREIALNLENAYNYSHMASY